MPITGWIEAIAPPGSTRRAALDHASAGSGGPLVSIVTPHHDVGSVLEETVRSVLHQSWTAWEWIIVDDGSRDHSALAVLEECVAADERIRLVRLGENRGPGAARNAGVAEASTELIVFLDADDQLEPTAVEKLFWYLESHPDAGFAQGFTVGFGAESYIWESGFHHGVEFLRANRAGITSMVRRSVHLDVGGFDEANRHGLEDWEYWLRCAAHGHWGGTVPEPLAWYRRRSSHGAKWSNWDDGEREEVFRSSLRERFPALWEGAFPDAPEQQGAEYEPIDDGIPNTGRLAGGRRRLLMVVPWLTVGGADQVNLRIAEHFTELGWGVTIVTTLDGDHSMEPSFLGVPTEVFALHRFLRPSDIPRFLRHLVESRAPEVVLVSNSELGYELLPWLRSHCPEPTYVDLVHAEQEDWRSGGHANFSVLAHDQLDATIVGSEHLRAWMVARGARPERLIVNHVGIDTDWWSPDAAERAEERAALGVHENTPVIVFTGRMAAEKRPEVAVRAFAASGPMDGRRLIMSGDGPKRSEVEQLVRDLDLGDAVDLVGVVPEDRLRALLRAGDILVLPSTREGIAVSVLEAMSCGLAVVATDVGGQAELIDGTTGVLVPSGGDDTTAAVAAEALARLASDADRRAALGAAARGRVVESFRIDAMLARFEAAFATARRFHEDEPRAETPAGPARAMATLAIALHRSDQGDRASIGGVATHAPVGEEETAPSASASTYGVLMHVLGRPYRWFKARYPGSTTAARDRIRSITGYERPDPDGSSRDGGS